jgi:hypothetical protein
MPLLRPSIFFWRLYLHIKQYCFFRSTFKKLGLYILCYNILIFLQTQGIGEQKQPFRPRLTPTSLWQGPTHALGHFAFLFRARSAAAVDALPAKGQFQLPSGLGDSSRSTRTADRSFVCSASYTRSEEPPPRGGSHKPR